MPLLAFAKDKESSAEHLKKFMMFNLIIQVSWRWWGRSAASKWLGTNGRSLAKEELYWPWEFFKTETTRLKWTHWCQGTYSEYLLLAGYCALFSFVNVDVILASSSCQILIFYVQVDHRDEQQSLALKMQLPLEVNPIALQFQISVQEHSKFPVGKTG